MSRKRGRPTQLDQVAVNRIKELRAQGASYAAIAQDLNVTKRTIIGWSALGRTEEVGLHREVRLALRVREVVAPPPAPSPSAIVDIQSANLRIADDGSWRREPRTITVEELQRLRELSDRRYCRGYDPEGGGAVMVEVCRPKQDAALSPQQTELVDGLLHLRVLDSQRQPLRIEFLPRVTE